MFGLVALTALALDKRKREGGMAREREREGGRRESLHADILPAGLVIDEPQSLWEPEMARLMNGAFLLPPQPTPTPQPPFTHPLCQPSQPLYLTLPHQPPPPCSPSASKTPFKPLKLGRRGQASAPSLLACPPSALLNRACAWLACQPTHTRTQAHT